MADQKTKQKHVLRKKSPKNIIYKLIQKCHMMYDDIIKRTGAYN